MKTLGANKLFTPIQVGSMELEHRVPAAQANRLSVLLTRINHLSYQL
jgi:hypothetical protein